MNDFERAIQLMEEQLGHDVIIALATSIKDDVSVRNVDGYYKDGSVYVVTHMSSHKMKEISVNPYVAVCKDLMCGKGIGESLGNPKLDQNKDLRKELKEVFVIFYERHVNEEDAETCILKITLKSAVIFDDNNKYIIDFDNETALRSPFVNDIVYK